MAKQAYATNEKKIEIIDSFVRDKLHGDTNAKIKFEDLAAYAHELDPNHDWKEYEFRRVEAIRQHIDDIHSGKVAVLVSPALSPYIAVGKESFARKICENPLLVLSLCEEMDTKCQKYSNEMCRLRRELSMLDNRCQQLSQENTILCSKLHESECEVQTLKSKQYQPNPAGLKELEFLRVQNRAYNTFFRKYVMKDIASLLLQEKRQDWSVTYDVLDMKAFEAVIEGQKPESVPSPVVTEEKTPDAGTVQYDIDNDISSLIAGLQDLTSSRAKEDAN